MASSVSVLLAKVARYRPRVLCFIGKGIWLHVERSLERNLLPKNDGSDDGIVTGSGAVVVPKREEEESPPMMIKADPDTPTKTKWPAVKAEEGVATFGASTSTTADSSSLDTGRALRSSSTVTMTVGRGSVTPARATPKKAAARPVFAYGLQPYKAVHEVIPKVRTAPARGSFCFDLTAPFLLQVANVRETLFCVFPSTSGRVVSHQVRCIFVTCGLYPQGLSYMIYLVTRAHTAQRQSGAVQGAQRESRTHQGWQFRHRFNAASTFGQTGVIVYGQMRWR